MQKLKLYLPVVLGFIMVHSINAQQVYQSGDYGGPGTIYLYNRLPGPSIDNIAQSGANLTWDLGSFNALNTHPTQIVTPSEGIPQFTFIPFCTLGGIPILDCFAVWASTDQALLLQDSLALFGFSLNGLQRYQDKTPNQLLENFFGFTVDFAGTPTQAVVVYDEPEVVLEFPVTYNDSWSSEVHWSIDLSATGQNIRYKSTQTRTSEVSAWGTVMTPFDTFTNVVRVRAEIAHQDTLFTDTLNLPVNITQVEYMWFDTAYKLPVMIAQGVVTDTLEVITVVEYIYEATCPTPTWTADTGSDVYYLDANGNVTVDFNINQPNANLYTWDFADGTIETSEGSTTHTYNLAGSYAVAVEGCMTNCLPLNTCSDAIVDFVILDTISSVLVIQGSDLGIKLYPNPVNESVAIEIPANLGNQHYRIIDLTGRQIDSGILKNGKTVVSSDSWPNGVYTIQFWNADKYEQQVAVMRFGVVKN